MASSPAVEDDADDVYYPCRGCGEILEEGKAFELAGQRWHIDCFRCHSCGTLLDSDANLLLLGDGSLICNNCTYSCSACGNKIEDLAILTGDQAFCASCFRCRNCKRKIENLRYARTSQGIFCMSCHESLMARRRKKAKGPPAARQAAPTTTANAPPADKALPSLPPGVVPQSAFSPDVDTPPSESRSGTPGARSPREQQLAAGREAFVRNRQRDVSPLSEEARRDGPTLPASTYGDSKPSKTSEDTEDGEERGFLPMAFDPTPAPGPPPTIPRKQVPRPQDPSPPNQNENRPPRDYFSGTRLTSKTAPKEAVRDELPSLTPRTASSTDGDFDKRVQPKASPHILFQEKGRNPRRENSASNTSSASAAVSPSATSSQDKTEPLKPQHIDTSSFTLHHNDGFKLQEVPKTKRAGSRGSSKAGKISPVVVSPVDATADDAKKDKTASPVSLDSPSSGVNPFDDPKRKEGALSNAAPMRNLDRPARGDSLKAAAAKDKVAASASEPGTPVNVGKQTTPAAVTPQAPLHERGSSVSSVLSSFADAQSSLSRSNSTTNGKLKTDGPSPPLRKSFDAPPSRALGRPTFPPPAGVSSAPSKSVVNGDFTAPRFPPPPPPPAAEARHKNSESISTIQSAEARSEDRISPAIRSAGLFKYSADGALSMEDEMARIMRGEERMKSSGESNSASVLRKVSNAVKHGRSFSDRGLNSLQKSPSSGPIEISSPIPMGSPSLSSPTANVPAEQLRAHLRRANQRVAELEAELKALEQRVDSSADIKAAETELSHKRDTMVVLDTQREMAVAELESMTAHLKKAKESNQPLDVGNLKSEILRDFAQLLQRLKDEMSSTIEELMHRRNELTNEIGNLIQMKDKGFQEYESLSSKNVQLVELNNQLVHNIQETYKANRAPNGGSANGLGIYHSGSRLDTPSSSDMRSLNLMNTEMSMANFLQEGEVEPATVLTAPQVVNIRKGQPKKFNWRRGGERVAKNITKGVKGAFVGERAPPGKDGSYDSLGLPYNQTQAVGGASDPGSTSIAGRANVEGSKGVPGFALFGQRNGGLKAERGLGSMKNNSSTNLAADASVLFGSELEARCEFEKRVVPSVVTRCVEEVEARGMDVEGIYRKSGGSGQVKTVQQGFEKDGNLDISDPDLDIHAVTSALKQYFRKLPTPLITYDVYETMLDAGQTADRDKQGQALRMAVAELPEHHRNCLEYLVQHLVKVMAHESENLMTPLNLSVVFAPTIMRPLSIEREMTDMQAQRAVVQGLLDWHQVVFDAEERG